MMKVNNVILWLSLFVLNVQSFSTQFQTQFEPKHTTYSLQQQITTSTTFAHHHSKEQLFSSVLSLCNKRFRTVISFSQRGNKSHSQIHDNGNNGNAPEEKKIRLNKVFKATHSRREADKLISSGRVTVNGEKVMSKGGFYVIPHVDIVALDGKVVRGWEDMNAVETSSDFDIDTPDEEVDERFRRTSISKNENSYKKPARKMTKSQFEYIKFFKPVGITCTTDKSVKGNIIESIERHGYKSPHRIYPVGRLDKETSGLILLTSDGRVPNAVLRGINKQPKVYKVEVDFNISDRDIQNLRDGIIITTVAQRDNKAKKLTQRTKPCKVERINSRVVRMTLMEGRNRQIRKMMGALGYTVTRLHRTNFMNISLTNGHNSRPRPGDWSYLDKNEMELVESALQSASLNQERMLHQHPMQDS